MKTISDCGLRITDSPKRPLLRYFGGKWQLRHWIIAHFPAHHFYAEPFCGAASVLLAKARARGGEIVNDLNGETINLFRVMQKKSQADELERRLCWTPYAKSELDLSREATFDPVERARRMVIRSFMGIEVSGVQGSKSGFRMGNVDLRRLDQVGTRTFRNTSRDWENWKSALSKIRERLAGVMIYEQDALKFISLMGAPDCLMYVDPPYHLDTRTRAHAGSRYAVEFGVDQHRQLVADLLQTPAMVILSGYPHADYAPLESAGWQRVEREHRANMSKTRRTECLWINPVVFSQQPTPTT
jgi:DNA adenine methylase